MIVIKNHLSLASQADPLVAFKVLSSDQIADDILTLKE